MTKLYLIRHAEAEGNLYRSAQGQYDSILTVRGWRQVRALEQRFAHVQIDAVYTSDLYRCCATASAIYKPRGLTPVRRQGLREICVGDWEQRTWGDIAKRDPEQLENFRHHLHLWHVEGAETAAQVQERMLDSLRAIAAENPDRTVAVVSHGAAIRLALAALQGYSLEELGKTPHGDNTAVSLVEVENGEMRVIFRDDNRHLTTPEYLAGEKVKKRSTALEPGLRFAPLDLPEQRETALSLAETGWADSGRTEAFSKEHFLRSVEARKTLLAYLKDDPAGLVQFGEEPGSLTFLTIRRDLRRQGYGVQLIGQGVLHGRPLGAERLWVRLPEDAPSGAFFREHGFAAQEDGIWEKDIGFQAEFRAIP